MGRREALKHVRRPPKTHAGLWLDRYLQSSRREDAEAKRTLVREVAGIPEPEEYRDFFRRYREALETAGAETRKARTLGRLVVGLGGEGVLETSLTLHRTYGVPYIPGSALKGLASRYAHLRLEGEAWRRDLAHFQRGEAQAALFGTQEEGGAVVFFDALPLPGEWKVLEDVLNPHHMDYYTSGDAPPADWDSPVPVPFLSVTGTFLLALAPAPGVSREAARPWLEAAWQILEWALEEEGVGAKTSSGYGRMRLEPRETPKRSSPYEALAARVRSLSYRELPDFLKKEAERILALSPEERDLLRQALEDKGLLKRRDDLKGWAKKDEAVRKALEALGVWKG
ncbi:type III-B CRISPR module RAMP protein Cmr6 [Thermus filiformis]|uniref:CRISPR-associated protein Cmr6 n=1 Tax=Thermus filiformis TaxID=276 RepID=A0A0A2X807_THEFI|nr:type III-B CRISPR module RAMP protein Cmr6 [Thermus filiformis]KGQ21374.2 CRISPR-associated protein Cmr6 [Thermus filiformis]